jgi:hypothetical protein
LRGVGGHDAREIESAWRGKREERRKRDSRQTPAFMCIYPFGHSHPGYRIMDSSGKHLEINSTYVPTLALFQ